MSETRPVIEWVPVAGVRSYRVQIQSRVPEGRVIATVDTETHATRFVPPQPLTNFKSIVRVRVRADCPDKGAGMPADLTRRFFIDTSSLCILRDELRVDARAHQLIVKWPPFQGALSYEAALFSALDGRLLGRQEARMPEAILSTSNTGTVVAVQPRCTSGWGESVYRMAAISSGR